jgi:glycosyltransferase involved in cell wall biosynthesis
VFTPVTGENRHYEYESVPVHKLATFFRVGQAPFTPGILAINDFDLIHLHFPYYFGAELTEIVSTIKKIPFIITYHNDVIKKGMAGKLVSVHNRYLVPFILEKAAYICVMSEHFKKSSIVLKRITHLDKLIVIPQGIDTAEFNPNISRDEKNRLWGGEKYILFVRSLDPAHYHSGLSFLLKAMQTISPTCHLVIVGDGSLRNNYENEAGDLGISERVHFLGSKDNRELPSLYVSAYAFVLPSSETENASVVLMEAMASGIPVVATNVGGTKAIVHHGIDGLLVNPCDPGEISHAINFLLENPKIAAEMGLTARAQVEVTSSWETIASKYEDVYEKVLCESV